MKKNLKRTLAIMLALLLTCSAFADYYVSARADETGENITGVGNPTQNIAENETGGQTEKGATSDNSVMVLANDGETPHLNTSGFIVSEYGVYLDRDHNNPLTDDSNVYSGQDVTVYFTWSIDENTRMSDEDYQKGFIPQEFTIDTNAAGFYHDGIDLSSFETGELPLYSTDGNRPGEVGYYYLEGGVIHIVITDGEFYQNTTNRVGGVAFHGKMEELEDPAKDGDKKKVKFGEGKGVFEADPNFFLSGNESSASVEKKRATNKVEVVEEAGGKKFYQTFTVTVKAENGTVTEIDLSDVTQSNPAGVLGNIFNVKITSSSVSGVNVGDYADMGAALQAIKDATFHGGDEVILQYTMEVSADIYKEGNNWANNGIRGTYTSNRNKKKNVESWTSVNVTKPSVTKTAAKYEGGVITWVITVDLGDYFKEGASERLKDHVKNIEDIPGEGLNASGLGMLDPDQFQYQGNGRWICEVTTPVDSSVQESLGDVAVKNSVTMTTNDDNQYTGEGYYTVQGLDDAYVEKSVAGAERNDDGLYITWKIVVSDLPEGITGLTLYDNPKTFVPNPGTQESVLEIYVDGDTPSNKVYEVVNGTPNMVQAGIISKVSDAFQGGWGEYSIEFEDTYIQTHRAFTVYVKTLVTEETRGHQYGNAIRMEYKDANTDDTKNVPGNTAVYREADNLLEKTGAVSGNAINYKLAIALSAIELVNGKNFVIEDLLPAEMKLDQNSVQVVLINQWENYEMYTLSKGSYNLSTATANGQRQKMTVTIPVQNDWLQKVVGHASDPNNAAYFLAVKYTAVVSDVADFTTKGETITCINEASATYDGQNIGSDSDERQLTPAKAVVKKAEYNQNTAPYAKFTVDVNPSGVTLLDGKEMLLVEDTVGWALSLEDTGNYSVKVYDVDNNRELDRGEYTYSIASDKRTMNMELPDGMHLRVEYWARVNPGIPLSEANSTNRFNLSGFTSEATESSTSFRGTAFTPDAWAGSAVGQIILYKFWTDGEGKQQALLNSAFTLDRMYYDEQTGQLQVDNNFNESDIYTFPRTISIDDNNRYGEGMLVIEQLPVNYIFRLTEISADEGFGVNTEPYYFTVDGTTTLPDKFKGIIHEFTSNSVLEYENYPGARAKIKISKSWSEANGTSELTWDDVKDTLSFVIQNKATGEVVVTCEGGELQRVGSTNTYESREYSVLPGTYVVEESNVLFFEDFKVDTQYKVTGDVNVSSKSGTSVEITLQESASVEVTYDNTYDYTGAFPVEISKRDITNSKEIGGAKLEVRKLDGTFVEGWTSVNGQSRKIRLKPGTYKLVETTAPKGYATTETITFTVENDGTIAGQTGNTVVMTDAPLDIQITKMDITNEEEVDGATLVVYHAEDVVDGEVKTGSKAVVPAWTSEKGQPKDIGSYLEEGKTYVLIETGAPDGYGYSESIEFTVEKGGKIQTNAQTEDTKHRNEEDTTKNNRILMDDRAIRVKMSKVDVGGEMLANAEIELYRASDIDENDNPNANAEPIDTWTSKDDEYFEFEKLLKAGEEYALVEKVAPVGYEKAAPIYFTVKSDGTIVVRGAAADNVETSGDALIIKMIDMTKEEKEKYSTLVLRKTFNNGIVGINDLGLLDKIGGLTFKVTNKTTGKSETYTLRDDFRKVNDAYVLTLEGLNPGEYTVEESNYTIEGMSCTVTYMISPDSAGGVSEDPSKAEVQLGENAVITVTCNDEYQYEMGKIKLAKTFESSGNAYVWSYLAQYLEFRIYDEKGNEIEGSPIRGTQLKANGNAYEYDGVKVRTGTYTVKEIDLYTGSDRRVISSYTVTVDGKNAASGDGTSAENVEIQNDLTTTVKFHNNYVRNHSVKISKRDLTNMNELEGATLVVYHAEDVEDGKVKAGSIAVIPSWTSGKTVREFRLEPGNYTLIETTAPKGYAMTESVDFTVGPTGTVTVNNKTEPIVIMKDAPLDIQVSKVDITGTKEVDGATLVVYHEKDVDDKGNPIDGRNPVVGLEPWISEKGQPKDIGSYLEVGKTYVLIETGTPKGYAYSESIRFTVKPDGSISTDNAKEYQADTIHPDSQKTTPGNRILMRDEAISIKLNKVELGSTTKELEGAIIGIYDADAVDANGRLINPDTQPLEAWKSEIDGYHEFGAELQAGHDYVFVETVAPDGYQFATSIRFTIKEDGSVENVSTVTGETVKSTGTGKNTVYLMEDDILTEPHATLVLTKSIKGEGVGPADVTKTNLRLHVESINVSPAYDQVFCAGGVGFEWDGENYVQKINNLIPGRYKVTELWDDYSTSEIVCREQSWEVVLGTETSTLGVYAGTGVATCEFELNAGYTAKVNYTNTYTYEQRGTLVITKTIKGDVTKEEAEGALQFTVTENSTGKQEIYTLKEDFVYNEGTWTKELLLVAGGYTVEESVNTSDGTTCTTTYTLNGGDPQEGTKVENVVLQKDSTTTVAYTNNYSAGSGSDSDSGNSSNSGNSNNNSASVLSEVVHSITTGLTRTGDSAPIGVWLLLLACGVAGAGGGWYAFRRKKKKDQEKKGL